MRRGNGEGSIFKLSGKRRKPWAVRVTVGWTEEGKQILKYVGYYEKKTDAKAALREYLLDPYDIDSSKITLQEVFDKWKDNNTVSATTLRVYTNSFKRATMLHKLTMREIKVAHIEGAMKDLTPNSANMLKAALTQLYIFAMKHEIVDKNIVQLIKVKQPEPGDEAVPFTVEQVHAIKNFKHHLTDTAVILLYTGMRINELLNIENKNVDLEKRIMIGGLKTTSGRNRIIPIHDEIYDLIKKRYNPDNQYLITYNNKKLVYNTYRRVFWNVMQEKLGVEQTPHDSRHTFVTYADKCKMNRISMQKIIGHKSVEVTDRYTHRTKEELIDEVNKLRY